MSAKDLKPGDVVDGRYQLERELGRGAMGVVYQATHQRLSNKVAIKFLDKEFKRSPEVVERFIREGRAALAVGHPGVVGVLDAGEMADGTSYLVMEHLDGLTLRALYKRAGVLRPSAASAVLLPMLDALEAAHSVGVIHRDLKPANVMLTSRRLVKIVDFGISKVNESKLTRAGAAMGTPDYMAPEQTHDAVNVTSAADLYSVGVIAYELLAGQLPLSARTVPEMMFKALTEKPPPLRSVATGLKPKLADLIDSLLLKDPKERPRSAAVVRALLADVAPPDSNGLWSLVSAPEAMGPTYVRPSPEPYRRTRATNYKPESGPQSVPEVARQPPTEKAYPRATGEVPPGMSIQSPSASPGPSRVQIPPGVPPPAVVSSPDFAGPKTGPRLNDTGKVTAPASAAVTEPARPLHAMTPPAAPYKGPRTGPRAPLAPSSVEGPAPKARSKFLGPSIAGVLAVAIGGAAVVYLQRSAEGQRAEGRGQSEVIAPKPEPKPEPPIVIAGAKPEPEPEPAKPVEAPRPPPEKKPEPKVAVVTPKKPEPKPEPEPAEGPPPPKKAPSKADQLLREAQALEQQDKDDEARAKYEACLAIDDGHRGCVCAFASFLAVKSDDRAAKMNRRCESIRAE